jgi:hypothetical protein
MIAYLLNKLPEDQRDSMEDRWMEDDDAYHELQDAESALLDAYSAGELSPEDRERVEKYLLASPAQKRKLQFARLLPEALPQSNRRSAPWLGLAAAAAILLLAGASGWLLWQNTIARRELAKAPAVQPGAAPVMVAEIRSDTVKRSGASSTAEIRLAAGAQIVRLDLQLDPGDESQPLSATIERDGHAVWSEQPVRAERRDFGYAAPVWVPATVLAPGEYQVSLSAGGAAVNYYRLRVVAP